MNARERQKATSAALRARIYPLFQSLGYSRPKIIPREDRFQLKWQRCRDGYLDQLDIGWSRDWGGRFIIHWLTGDLRRLSPAHRGAVSPAGNLLRPPRRGFDRSCGAGWFVAQEDVGKEMDVVEARFLELDRYLKFGTPMAFISLPGTSPQMTPRLWALHDADVAAERAKPLWLLREIFIRKTVH